MKKPHKRIEVTPFWGEWRVVLRVGKRRAQQVHPLRNYCTKRATLKAAVAWADATGWPLVED